MQLDSQLRIVERDYNLKFDRDKSQRIYERVQFSKWENHHQENGEAISFPMQVSVQYAVGVTAAGALAVYREAVHRVKAVDFNQPIEASQFTIDFPEGTAVNDGRAP